MSCLLLWSLLQVVTGFNLALDRLIADLPVGEAGSVAIGVDALLHQVAVQPCLVALQHLKADSGRAAGLYEWTASRRHPFRPHAMVGLRVKKEQLPIAMMSNSLH